MIIKYLQGLMLPKDAFYVHDCTYFAPTGYYVPYDGPTFYYDDAPAYAHIVPVCGIFWMQSGVIMTHAGYGEYLRHTYKVANEEGR